MSEFEFMRAMPFGPYLPDSSPVRRLDPRTRILVVVILMISLLAAQNLWALAAGLLMILLSWWSARVPFEPLRRGWLSVLPFLIILALIQVLFRSGADPDAQFAWKSLIISTSDLIAGVALLLRFSAFIALLGLAAASLSESEITHGLGSLLKPLSMIGIPVHDFILAIQVSLRYFPLLSQSAERIAKAQASRGADWRPAGWNLVQRARQIIPLIVPLFVSSLRRAENMALAMDARGYGGVKQRTSLVKLHYSIQDFFILVVSLGLAVFMIMY